MAVTREQVAEIYVATFDRAPDTAGLDYWVHSGLSIEAIAESFFGQDETKEKYPDALSNADFVNTVYLNVYNRDAEPNGLAYWAGELDSGNISRADLIIAMVNGAQGTDQDTLDNKVEVGLYFADNGTELTYEQSVDVMKDVTSDDASVDIAKSEIDIWSSAAQSFTLTVKTDTITGTDLDESITGLIDADPAKTTLNTADTIDGAGGNNTLKLTNTATAATTTQLNHMSNVQTIDYTNSATADQTINMAGTTGVDTISISGTTGNATTFDNVIDIVDLELNGNTGNTTITYAAATVIGANDTMNIAGNSWGYTTTVEGIENVNIATGDVNTWNDINLTDAALNTVVASGAGWISLYGTGSATGDATMIDLSATTGGAYVNSTIVDSVNGATVISGKGEDYIELNTGNDTVKFTAADQSRAANDDYIYDFEAAKDTINLTGAIQGGTGHTVAAAEFTTAAAALAEGDTMTTVTIGGAGSNTYYIDVNNDNIYNASIDMQIYIEADVADLTAADFIV